MFDCGADPEYSSTVELKYAGNGFPIFDKYLEQAFQARAFVIEPSATGDDWIRHDGRGGSKSVHFMVVCELEESILGRIASELLPFIKN